MSLEAFIYLALGGSGVLFFAVLLHFITSQNSSKDPCFKAL
jgi:hypothetical protein